MQQQSEKQSYPGLFIKYHYAGRFTFNIFASLAEFEQEIIRERTKAGVEAAKARDRPGGISSTDMEKAKPAKLLYDSGTKTGAITKILEKSRKTFYCYIEMGYYFLE